MDFDQVTLSSLNRHAVATLADVGLPKVRFCRGGSWPCTPWVRWDPRGEKFDGEYYRMPLLGSWEGDESRKPDFIVDAIEPHRYTKVTLLKYCYDRNLPVISAMGAGIKSDQPASWLATWICGNGRPVVARHSAPAQAAGRDERHPGRVFDRSYERGQGESAAARREEFQKELCWRLGSSPRLPSSDPACRLALCQPSSASWPRIISS